MIGALLTALATCAAAPAAPTASAAAPGSLVADSVRFGRFGPVALYGDARSASQVVLFVSGDGGWNLGVVEMAQHLAAMDALVVGIDIRHYLAALDTSTDPCSYPAADFEALSQYVQKSLGRPRYTTPVLVGYSSGATLVYALLVQAPPNTFRGAISLGFCPDLDVRRPLCAGAGLRQTVLGRGKGFSFLRAEKLTAPWFVFQGDVDQVCNPDSTRLYVQGIPGAELVWLPKVGHGFGVEARWLSQFRTAFARLSATANEPAGSGGAVADLPLVEVPGPAAAPEPAAGSHTHGGTMAVVLSGDGGWAGIDRDLGQELAREGLPVVGLNSLQYFWRPKTPDSLAIDLGRVIEHYRSAWGRDSVVLVGYSFGADVLPFAVNRLPPEIRARIAAVALIGASATATFEFHVGEWLGRATRDEFPTLAEIRRLPDATPGARVVCVYGTDDTDSVCPTVASGRVQVAVLPGGHHFGGDFARLAAVVLRATRGRGTGP